MMRFFSICLGGAFGTGARYLLSSWLLARMGAGFPYGTFAVNFIGSFLLGGIMHVGMTSEMLSPTARLTLSAGVMGGFTTYSTFSYETLRFFQAGAWGIGVLNIFVTLLGCLMACLLGAGSAKWMLGS